MNKEVLLYIIIFLIAALITLVVLFIVYINKPEIEYIYDDFYNTNDSLYYDNEYGYELIEPIEPSRHSFIDRVEPPDETLNEQEVFLKLLTQRLQALYGIKQPEDDKVDDQEVKETDYLLRELEIVKAQMDSIKAVMQAEIDSLYATIIIQRRSYQSETDSLKKVINDSINENLTQKRTISLREQSNLELRNQISSLNNIITGLKNDIHTLKNPIIIETIQLDHKKLADVYNNMDAKKVANLLQTLPQEQAVNVLIRMNQRKRAQVMSTLPKNVASQYSTLIMKMEKK